MGKISIEARKRYFEKINGYKISIDQIFKREQNLLQLISTDEKGADYKRLILADEYLNLVSLYLLMNALSVSLLGVKNEAYLNDARKGCYKSIIVLEEIVTNYVDVPFSEYEEQLKDIEGFDDEKRWQLVCKLGFSIQSVIDGFGDNSKWKWSFVELEGRFATITKNLLNMKVVIAGMDPRVPGYEVRFRHLSLAKKLLQQTADRYRQKYELSTLRIDDFKIAINYLSALRRLHIILGETNDAEIVRKKIEVWKNKMETDLRNLENQDKKQPQTTG